jgi:hypothetical protein
MVTFPVVADAKNRSAVGPYFGAESKVSPDAGGRHRRYACRSGVQQGTVWRRGG